MLVLSINFIDGAYIEIDSFDKSVEVLFINKETSKTIFRTVLAGKQFAKLFHQYYLDLSIQIVEGNKLLYQYDLELKGRNVLISFESKSLGDTLAWIPYVEEFRRKHKCNISVSTFWNSLFTETYPDIIFINPGTQVHNLFAVYRLGLFYNAHQQFDKFKHPSFFLNRPLQQIASDILGLEFKELRPKLNYPAQLNANNRRIAIATQSTCQAKYWNNPTGWEMLTDFLISKGYEVIVLSKEPNGYMGNYYPSKAKRLKNNSIENVIYELENCSLFIGLSSGLTWLAWALKVKTYMISGFSEVYTEPEEGITKIRVQKEKNICTGCFNNFPLDKNDWNWCPKHKDTNRQFECTRLITYDMVISNLELK